MNRPETPPTKPYTLNEMLSMIEQHFIQDNSPRCARGNIPWEGTCIYGKTGCGVGFMLTKEDAEEIDDDGVLAIEAAYNRFPNIYSKYFTPEHLLFLQTLQSIHDRSDSPECLKYSMLGFVMTARGLLEI